MSLINNYVRKCIAAFINGHHFKINYNFNWNKLWNAKRWNLSNHFIWHNIMISISHFQMTFLNGNFHTLFGEESRENNLNVNALCDAVADAHCPSQWAEQLVTKKHGRSWPKHFFENSNIMRLFLFKIGKRFIWPCSTLCAPCWKSASFTGC